MKLSTPIAIDLLEFIKTGKFDYLKLGKTKEWVLNNFPDPDNFESETDQLKKDIWFYGDIEIHFYKNELSLIYSDYITTLSGGESLKIDKWIFSDPGSLKLIYVIEHLNKEQIDFTKLTESELNCVRLFISKSNVGLLFAMEDDEVQQDPNDYKLSAISFSAR